jgi:hypothetical protein
MRFSVAERGTALPPPSVQPLKLPRLAHVWKNWTSPGVWGPVKAVTADAEWLFVRAEDGTWAVGHLPTETEVKDGLRSPRACRLYVGEGSAQADLDRIQAEGREAP